jgi:hypothetical protein
MTIKPWIPVAVDDEKQHNNNQQLQMVVNTLLNKLAAAETEIAALKAAKK